MGLKINPYTMKTLNKLNQMVGSLVKILLSFTAVIVSLSIIGCTGDKDLADFRKQQQQQAQGRNAAANGLYVGPVVSVLDRSAFGKVTMYVHADSSLQNSSDNLNSEKKAVITGWLRYEGLVSSQVPFTTAFYDPDSGDFSATVIAQDEAQVNQQIDVRGNIQHGSFVGSVYMDSYPEYALKTVLNVNANQTEASVDASSIRRAQISSDTQSYSGSLTHGNTNVTAVLKIGLPRQAAKVKLLRILNPTRLVNVSADLGFGAGPMPFTGSDTILDDTTNTLSGSTTITTSGVVYPVTMICERISPSQGWHCTFNQGKYTFVVDFSPIAGSN